MRTFVVVGHKATLCPTSLEDIPGTSRLDILCRSVTAALSFPRHPDVLVYLVLLGGRLPRPSSWWVRPSAISIQTRTTAALLKKALAVEAKPEWTMSTSGIFVRTGGLEEVIEELNQKSARLIYLREDGKDLCSLRDEALAGGPAFILGDHTGMTAEEESLLSAAGAQIIGLGPTSLHADHCIVITNWLLDTNAFISGLR